MHMIGKDFLIKTIEIKKPEELEYLDEKISKLNKEFRVLKEEIYVDFGEYKEVLLPSLGEKQTRLIINIRGLLRNADNIIQKHKELIQKNLTLIGVLKGNKAFRGPLRAEIYLTNRCNNNCIACWDRSPLIKVTPEKLKWLNLEMDKETAIRLIKDLNSMGCEEVFFSGGGEPTMHPNFLDIIRLVKKLGMRCQINTNFTLVNKKILKEFVDLKVDGLLVSLWAATPETYVKTHPNKTEKTFKRIKENLEYLNELKKKKKSDLPTVSIYNVIMNLNYKEVVEMFDFAIRYANYCFLVPVDVVEGQTDILLLNDKQKKFILDREKILKEKIKILKRKNKRFPNNNVIEEQFSSFMRRIKEGEVKTGKYDKKFVNTIPCYVGWTYLRVLPNGEVTTCLKSHFKPIGERHYIENHSIKELWFSPKWNQFRKDALTLRKDSDKFKKYNIPCTKSCDNYMDNLVVHNNLQKLSYRNLIILHIAAYMLDRGYQIK